MTDHQTARVTADDIPTSVTKLVYTAPWILPRSQNDVAELFAHFWPAIERHFRDQVLAEAAELLAATSAKQLDEIDEDDLCPSDMERHQQWCEAANVLLAARTTREG